MTPEESNLTITLLANAMAQGLTDQQLVQAAAVLTQLGTTLSTLAALRALDASTAAGDAEAADLSTL